MGPGGLNYRVRDGNGCDPSGKVAGNSEEQSTVDSSQSTAKSCELSTADCSLNSVASFLTFGGHLPPLKKGELLTVDC